MANKEDKLGAVKNVIKNLFKKIIARRQVDELFEVNSKFREFNSTQNKSVYSRDF